MPSCPARIRLFLPLLALGWAACASKPIDLASLEPGTSFAAAEPEPLPIDAVVVLPVEIRSRLPTLHTEPDFWSWLLERGMATAFRSVTLETALPANGPRQTALVVHPELWGFYSGVEGCWLDLRFRLADSTGQRFATVSAGGFGDGIATCADQVIAGFRRETSTTHRDRILALSRR